MLWNIIRTLKCACTKYESFFSIFLIIQKIYYGMAGYGTVPVIFKKLGYYGSKIKKKLSDESLFRLSNNCVHNKLSQIIII